MWIMVNLKRVGACQRGYTLTEIAVVCAIVGILAGIALPNMITWRRSQELQAAASAISTAMYQARTTAIGERKNYTLTMDYTNDSYTTTKAGEGAQPGTNLGAVDLYSDDSDVLCPPLSGQDVVFRPNSTTDSAGYEAVYLKSQHSSITTRYRVRVLGPTGKVAVEKWRGGAWQSAY